jgi:hypothetical protein
MEAGPLDALERAQLKRARTLVPGAPPAPWNTQAVISAAWVLAAGWDDEENIVLISNDGYSVSAARTGERLIRNRDASVTYAALSADHLSFTVPDTGRTISVFGLASGDGVHTTGDGWHLEVIYPWWPRATVLLIRPYVYVAGSGPDDYYGRAQAIEFLRLEESNWVRTGFSPSGRSAMIVGSAGVEVMSRDSTPT